MIPPSRAFHANTRLIENRPAIEPFLA